MKLLAKYNRINLLVTISVLLVSSVCFYIMIRNVLISQLDEDIKVEEQEIIDFVKTHNNLPSPSNYKDQQTEFTETKGDAVKSKFSSIRVFSKQENSGIPTRQYQFPLSVAGKTYTVFIRKSQEETEGLIKMIALITLGVVVLLLVILFLINRFLLSRLWEPFNATLAQLKQFDLSANKELQLEHTGITEFAELNRTALMMTGRVKQDYETLKDFTDNASHEIQTPLAIINSKLDVLIQDETVSEFQMQQLQGVYNALGRLSSLNKSLLLLTKIENNQFSEQADISLHQLVKEKLTQFEELAEEKKLTVTAELQPAAIRGNLQLIDVLISNLLSNAIRYNVQNGNVFIKLSGGFLCISNSSFLPALDSQKVFQRFYRHADTKQEGNGLGLSIVKQICSIAGYSIAYRFANDRQEFLVGF